jgi:hypothetical protein
MNANDPQTLSAVAYGMLDLALDADALAQNLIPSLPLIGENDEFQYTADRAMLVGRNMSVHVLEDQDHLSAIFDPDFGNVVVNFLLDSN